MSDVNHVCDIPPQPLSAFPFQARDCNLGEAILFDEHVFLTALTERGSAAPRATS